MQHVGFSSLTRDPTCIPPQCKRGVLTTGPPGKSQPPTFSLSMLQEPSRTGVSPGRKTTGFHFFHVVRGARTSERDTMSPDPAPLSSSKSLDLPGQGFSGEGEERSRNEEGWG